MGNVHSEDCDHDSRSVSSFRSKRSVRSVRSFRGSREKGNCKGRSTVGGSKRGSGISTKSTSSVGTARTSSNRLSSQELDGANSNINPQMVLAFGSNPMNVKIVKQWVQAYDEHDELLVEALMSTKCKFKFQDRNMEISAEEFHNEILNLYESFPCLQFSWDSIMEIEPGIVQVKNYYPYGTHTGKPYSYDHNKYNSNRKQPAKNHGSLDSSVPPSSPQPPAVLPPIQPNHQFVSDNPIQLTFTIEKKKIVHCNIWAHGKQWGPPNLYNQLKTVKLQQ